MALFKIFKENSGKYKFFLKLNNNQVILVSKEYSSRLVCFNQIKFIKKFALKDDKYQRHITKNDSPYFTFKGIKNEVVSKSEKFMSTVVMENIIDLIKTNAKEADIDSMTYSM